MGNIIYNILFSDLTDCIEWFVLHIQCTSILCDPSLLIPTYPRIESTVEEEYEQALEIHNRFISY